MIDREKLIKGIGICVALHSNCGECPYNESKDFECINRLRADALAILAEPEARVMTLGEVRDSLKTPIWKEVKSRQKDLYQGWVLTYDVQTGMGITGARLGMSEPSGRVVWYKLEDYGRTWRCWTARPMEVQREAMAWKS